MRCRNATALIDFLERAFGFVPVAVYRDGEAVAHAQLDWPDGGGIMLGDDRPGAQWPQRPGAGGAYVVCADPDALHERAAAAGAEILMPPTDQDHGSRDFTARDPEGNLWSFGTYRGEPRPG
ncbi:MAG: VOC family protein [Solirubrobacterales bacterium]